jgi:long-chain acyl-CoA synthetase
METQDLQPIIAHFYKWEKQKKNEVFLRQPKGNSWKEMTWGEAGQEARKIATALKKLGIQKGDHVGIYSKNCYHWILADLAIMMAGAVSVPYYASLPKGQLEEVVKLSDIKLLFVGKLDHWGDKFEALPEDVKMIRFPHYEDNAIVTEGLDWNELLLQNDPMVEDFIPDLDDLWTIKFTSGTTGTPKGVMHIHRTPSLIMANEWKTGWLSIKEIKDLRCLSFLPLNHVGERLGLEVPCIIQGGTISFAESLDTFAQNLRDTRPTLFFAVPRIWMKFYLGVIAQMPKKKMDLLFSIPIVSTLVKKKLLKALGLDQLQVAATGAAITPEFLKKWYSQLGIHLIEAYGMTEVCGSMCNSPMKDAPSDSVGKPIPLGQVKLDPESGEVLMTSPYVMQGYYKNPEKTAEVLVDGWVRSGDRGVIDEQGFVKIIGRVGDAFKTSKGSYVIPNPMEEVLSQNDYVEQCCVVGLGIPQPICLINLSEQGKTADRSLVENSLSHQIEEVNKSVANYSRISTIVIQSESWSEANQLITPTLKVRRGGIDDRYSKQYLDWHEDQNKIIWS